MLDLFNPVIPSTGITPAIFTILVLVSLVLGALISLIHTFRNDYTKSFIMTLAILPAVVCVVILMVNGNIGAGVAIGGAFGLIRFRSAQGSADEIAAILVAMGSGIAFGMGYLAYGVIILLFLGALFLLLGSMSIFEHKNMAEDRLLRITIPESLEYNGTFDEIFAHYLKRVENAGVKTTGMGSMFRLSYKVQMKNPAEEKAFIDELRTKNGNLEISVLPYTETQNQL